MLTSLASGADRVVEQLATDRDFAHSSAGVAFLADAARIVGAQGDTAAIAHLLDLARAAVDRHEGALGFSMAAAVMEGSRRSAHDSPIASARDLLARAGDVARDGAADKADRLPAIALLAFDEYERAAPTLLSLATANDSMNLQLPAIAALDRFPSPQVADDLLSAWAKINHPRVRAEVVSVLLKRPERARKLLLAIKSGQLHQSDLSAQQVNLLLASADSSVRRLARENLSPPTTQRAAVIESFHGAISLTGSHDRGHVIYAQRCISCHRAGDEGSAVGPDLVTVRNAGKEKNLINILDPSREVAASYIAFEIETRDGQSYTGIITSDTTTTITIRQAYGHDVVIPRPSILHMNSHGKSLMPDGLEAGLKGPGHRGSP